MFGIEQMSRRCLIELSDVSGILAILTIPKPTKPIFPEKMEREFIESFNKQQPNMVNKVVKCHVMRN
nr:MAG TPA: hypothetical protein [Caudoviricetes sp.]